MRLLPKDKRNGKSSQIKNLVIYSRLEPGCVGLAINY